MTLLSLSSLALRQLVDGACTAVGVPEGGNTAVAVALFLKERFTDHSQRLSAALLGANQRAWKALELALVGDSLLERCKAATARIEDKAFARQVRAFLDATPLPEHADMNEFRPKCLGELRAARKAGLLTMGDLPPGALAEQAGAFARFSDPQSLLDGEWRVVQGMALTLKEAGYMHLALLLTQRPPQGTSLLVSGARYFFRRAIEDDPKLAQGLAFSQMERLSKTQEEGFASLAAAMTQQGQRLEELLGDVRAVVVETHSAVLDLQGQIEGQSEHIQQIGEAVQKLLEQHQLQRREVRPGDSLSIRNDNERQLVKQLVARYRALPEEERRQVPALLNGIGKLEVVAGDFDAARKDFAAVATLVEDNTVQAEAHFNAYQVCLERRDWAAAIQEFVKAVKLDGKRFVSFPVGKYQPQRILGAGGFDVAFLCKHKYMDAQVVVKTLMLEDLGRDADKVFTEAQLLRQLDHPAIIRISDCGYVDAANKSRPFLVMDYFAGGTLEEYVKKQGALSVDDLLAVARPVAEGLQAAHGKGILHRDVKPANLLVRKGGASWQVKVIDFGLALQQKVMQTSRKASASWLTKTLIGESMSGTLDYAAPEQMGKAEGAKVGPYSDVYGFGQTCYYALLGTPDPDDEEKERLPPIWRKLLSNCTARTIDKRLQDFGAVLERLGPISAERATEKLSQPRQPVSSPQEVASPPILPPPLSAIPMHTWYYTRDGEQSGPLAQEEIKLMIASGKIRPHDLVWRNGIPDWVRADSIRDFVTALAVCPPPPRSRKVARREGIEKILDRFVGQPSFYRAPNIPDRKLRGSATNCKLAGGESVLALIDCTVFGSATDCVLFTDKAMHYYHHCNGHPNPGCFPYRTLAGKKFSTYWISCVSFGDGDYIVLAGSSFTRISLIALLDAIRDLVTNLEDDG